jgi:hypothetical protein
LTLFFIAIWIQLRKPLALKKYESENPPEEPGSGSLVPIEVEKKSK